MSNIPQDSVLKAFGKQIHSRPTCCHSLQKEPIRMCYLFASNLLVIHRSPPVLRVESQISSSSLQVPPQPKSSLFKFIITARLPICEHRSRAQTKAEVPFLKLVNKQKYIIRQLGIVSGSRFDTAKTLSSSNFSGSQPRVQIEIELLFLEAKANYSSDLLLL